MFVTKKKSAIFGAVLLCATALSANAYAEWGAIAAGIDEYGNTSRVAVGSAIGHPTEQSARNAALQKCREGGVRNCRVQSTFSGCGYVTTSTNGSRPVAWGMGATGQQAYNECYRRIRSGNCILPAIGGCN